MIQDYQIKLGTSSRDIDQACLFSNQGRTCNLWNVPLTLKILSDQATIADVQARRAEVKAELLAIHERLRILGAEDEELVVAERVLLRLAGVPQALPSNNDDALGDWMTPAGWNHPNRPAPMDGTIEEVIEWLLEGSVSYWATSAQLQAALAATLKRPVPMSTVSPTLSNMKNKGIIVRDGLKVALAKRIEKAATVPVGRP
jgi:hypothetical protein